MRVETIGLFRIEGQRLHRAVGLLQVNVRPALGPQLCQLRLCFGHLVKVVIHDGRLLQLRGQAVDFRTILAVQVNHVGDERRGKEALAVFSSHDKKDLAEYPQARFVHDAEHKADGGLLPKLQGYEVIPALAMVAECLYKPDSPVCFLVIEIKKTVPEAGDDPVI